MNQEQDILDTSFESDFNFRHSPILVSLLGRRILSVAKHFKFDCKCDGKCNVNLLGDVIWNMGLWGICFLDENGYVYSPASAKGKKIALRSIRSPLPTVSLSQLEELIHNQKMLQDKLYRKLDSPGFNGIISLSGGSSIVEKQRFINKLNDGEIAVLEQDFKVCEYNTLDCEHYFNALRDNENRIAQLFGIPGGLLGRNFTHSNYEAALSDLEATGKTIASFLDKSFKRLGISQCFQLKQEVSQHTKQPEQIATTTETQPKE